MVTKKPGKPEFIIAWEFLARTGKAREFERVYGSDGAWAKFFRSGKGYIRTELIRELKAVRRYLTIDVWTSREAYLRFKKENRVEYHAIDKKCASLTEDEKQIGEFYRVTSQGQSRP